MTTKSKSKKPIYFLYLVTMDNRIKSAFKEPDGYVDMTQQQLD